MTTALAKPAGGRAIVPVKEIKNQLAAIQTLMAQTMVEKQDYGIIPGTPKPSLWEAGAEKLGIMFDVFPEFEILESVNTADYCGLRVRCRLRSKAGGQQVGEAIAACNSAESKYQRTAETAAGGTPLPLPGGKKWAELTQAERAEVKATQDRLLAEGKGFWQRGKFPRFMVKSEEGAAADGADPIPEKYDFRQLQNTIEAIAQKRAYVRAVRRATAAGVLFSPRDLIGTGEEAPEDVDTQTGEVIERPPEEGPPPKKVQSKADRVGGSNGAAGAKTITDNQRKRLFALAKECGVMKGNEDTTLREIVNKVRGIESTTAMTVEQYDRVVALMREAAEGGAS